MRTGPLRPISVGVITLIVGLSVIGFVAMRGVVAADRDKILTERGAAVTYLLESSVQQEIASIKVLGEVAAADPVDAQRTLTAGSKPLQSLGANEIVIARATGSGYRVIGAVGGKLQIGDRLTGARARLTQMGSTSVIGTSSIVFHNSHPSLGLAVPVGDLVVFSDSAIDPTTPLATPGPFKALRGAVYAGPTADPRNLVLTTESHLPITGSDVQRQTFLVGTTEWSVYFGAAGDIVGSWTANLPWLVLAAGLALAFVIAIVLEILVRRRAFAEHLTEERTKSLAAANAELSDTRAFLRQLVHSGPLVTMVISPESLDASYVSPNITTLFEVSETAAMTPEFLRTSIHPAHLSKVRATVAEAARETTDGYTEVEFQLRMGGGQSRWVSAVAVPAIGGGSVILYALDIDARRQAEQAQEAAQAAADAANRSKSEFLSRMSHELRTPLNAILGYAQILEMDDLVDEQVQSVEQILTSGRHLLELINEVLDISRIEVGQLSLSVEPVDIAEVMDTALMMVRPAAARSEITLRTPATWTPPTVLADRQRLRQVLLNLLTNAINYNQFGGSVTVASDVLDDGETVRISVTDTGLGIREDQYDLVFAPFERLGADQTGVEGTGIGLALSRYLAEAMGGSLGLMSEFGHGSTFWIDLPLTERTGQLDCEVPAPRASHEDCSERGALRVLHVEDNPANLSLVDRILHRVEGIEVISSTSGAIGLEVARRELPDVILLDLHLPDVSGEDVLAWLRTDDATQAIPVVVVSADATPGKVERLLAAGATAYLTKPIDVRELLDIVQSVGSLR